MGVNRLRSMTPSAQVGNYLSSSIAVPSAPLKFVPGSLVPIASTTLTANTATVSFSGIPQTFQDLYLVIDGTFGTDKTSPALRFNGDAGSNYSDTYIYGNGTSVVSSRQTNLSFVPVGFASQTRSTNVVHILNYANTVTNKSVLSRGGLSNDIVIARVGLWRNTNAITSILVTQEATQVYQSGSTFNLYGVRAS